MNRFSVFLSAALAAAVSFPAPALAQRESLSERVARLEQAMQESGGGEEQRQTLADLVYELGSLQEEVRQLRGLIEEQRFEIDNLRGSQQDQYLDLDRRISALGSGAARGAGGTAGSAPLGSDAVTSIPADRPVATAPATAPAVEPPEVREAVVADLETRALGAQEAGAAVAMVDPAAEQAAYDRAFEALKNGRYADASRQFSAFVESFPGSELADNAQYWLGESYYVTRNYRVALEAFQRLLSAFPDSAKRPDAQLKIGLSYYSLQNWDAAESELAAVIESYPDTTVSRLAQNRLRTMRIEGYID